MDNLLYRNYNGQPIQCQEKKTENGDFVFGQRGPLFIHSSQKNKAAELELRFGVVYNEKNRECLISERSFLRN